MEVYTQQKVVLLSLLHPYSTHALSKSSKSTQSVQVVWQILGEGLNADIALQPMGESNNSPEFQKRHEIEKLAESVTYSEES